MGTLKKVADYKGQFNSPLGINLPSVPILVSDGLRKHIEARHNDCLQYMDKIPEKIEKPDYIGKNPKSPTVLNL